MRNEGVPSWRASGRHSRPAGRVVKLQATVFPHLTVAPTPVSQPLLSVALLVGREQSRPLTDSEYLHESGVHKWLCMGLVWVRCSGEAVQVMTLLAGAPSPVQLVPLGINRGRCFCPPWPEGWTDGRMISDGGRNRIGAFSRLSLTTQGNVCI